MFFTQRFVKMATEAVCIGTAQAKDSYLRMDRILEAIEQTGSQVRSKLRYQDLLRTLDI